MSYTPQAGSMVSKLIDFFNINGDEELTADDIAAKFAVSAASVHSCLYKSIEAGLIIRKKNDDGEYVYAHVSSAGSASRSPWPVMPAKSASPFVNTPKKQRKSRTPVTLIDLAVVELEEDIPMVTVRPQLDWPGLFNRMKPGQSCLLPNSVKYTCLRAITDFNNAGHGELKRKTISDEQFRLWRLV